MLEGMTILRVPAWQTILIYIAVRLFGGLAWKRNQWTGTFGITCAITVYKCRTGARIVGWR